MEKFNNTPDPFWEDMTPDELDVDQAELAIMKNIDHILLNAPMVSPSTDFVTRFEMRLERRVNRRKTWVGVSIISLILSLSTLLLIWSLADSGQLLLNTMANTEILNGLVDGLVNLLQSSVAGLVALARVLGLLTDATFQFMRHPAFWGSIAVASGMVLLWAQILRRLSFRRFAVTA